MTAHHGQLAAIESFAVRDSNDFRGTLVRSDGSPADNVPVFVSPDDYDVARMGAADGLAVTRSDGEFEGDFQWGSRLAFWGMLEPRVPIKEVYIRIYQSPHRWLTIKVALSPEIQKRSTERGGLILLGRVTVPERPD